MVKEDEIDFLTMTEKSEVIVPFVEPVVLHVVFTDLPVVSTVKDGEAVQELFDVEVRIRIDLKKLKGLAVKAARNGGKKSAALNEALVVKAVSVEPSKG